MSPGIAQPKADLGAVLAEPDVRRACAGYRDALLALQANVRRGSEVEEARERGFDDAGEMARLRDANKTLHGELGDRSREIDALVGEAIGSALRRSDLEKADLGSAQRPAPVPETKQEKPMATTATCMFPGCDDKVSSKKLCGMHVQRARRLVHLGEAEWDDLATPEQVAERIASPAQRSAPGHAAPRPKAPTPRKEQEVADEPSPAVEHAPRPSRVARARAAVVEEPKPAAVTPPAAKESVRPAPEGAEKKPVSPWRLIGMEPFPSLVPVAQDEREALSEFLAGVIVKAIRRLVVAS